MHTCFKPLVLATAIASLSHSISANELLEEIVVTASRNEMPLRQVGASVSVITSADIQLQGHNALMDALRTQPGIAVSNSGGPGKQSSLRIRGEEGYRTLVLIDGVEMSDPTGTQVGTPFQDLQSGGEIDRIEILRGPQGFIYGADAGGVVNILTITPDTGFAGDAGIDVGNYNSEQLHGHLAYGAEAADVLISVSDFATDGFNAREDDSSGETDGYDNTTLHSKFGLNVNPQTRATLVARRVEAESEYDACGYPTTHNCVSKSQQTIGKLAINYNGEKQDHSLAYTRTEVDRSSHTNNTKTFATSGHLNKAEYTGSYQWNSALTTVFGSDYKNETVDVIDDDDLARDQLGVYGELQAGLADSVYLTGGARFDDNDDFGTHTSMRVSAAWLPIQTQNTQLKTRTSIGNGFRAPALQEIAYNQSGAAFGNAAATELKEESSQGVDVGIEWYRSLDNHQRFSLEATVFYQTIEDEIYFDLVDFSGYLQSDGESKSRGLELAGDYQLNPILAIFANATYNTTKTRDDQARIRRPERVANLGVRLTFREDTLRLLANLRRVSDAVNEIYGVGRKPLDDYEVLDISVNWKLGSFLISGRLENATDEEYQEVTDYNTAERSAYLGATYRF